MRIGDISIGSGEPLVLISGLNVIESLEATLRCATSVQAVAARYGVPVIFKASFDKANRSSRRSYRGPGIDEGLRILARVKTETGMPVLTDVHEPVQAKVAAEVADCIQVPAFLCRQTDLLAACASTGRAINVKRGQFVAPHDMRHAVEKLHSFGAEDVMLTERGSAFGYNDLVVDMRGLLAMRDFAPTCFDATHAVQHPGAGVLASSGDRRYVAPLARAAVALGVDALFIEVHEHPDRAPCDGACQIRIEDLDRLLAEACAIEAALPHREERSQPSD